MARRSLAVIRTRYFAALGIASLGLIQSACTPAATPGENEVFMQGIAFDPETITIEVGETITWTNRDLVAHTATSGNPDADDFGTIFRSGSLSRGETFSFTFTEAGDYEYFCEPHANTMFGAHVIVVEPEGG